MRKLSLNKRTSEGPDQTAHLRTMTVIFSPMILQADYRDPDGGMRVAQSGLGRICHKGIFVEQQIFLSDSNVRI